MEPSLMHYLQILSKNHVQKMIYRNMESICQFLMFVFQLQAIQSGSGESRFAKAVIFVIITCSHIILDNT